MGNEDLLSTIIENLYDGLYYVDRERKITLWNKSAERITGFSREEVVGRHCYDNILRHLDQEGNALCFDGCPLAAAMKEGKAREASIFLHHKEGYRVPVSVRVSPIRGEGGKVVGAVEIFSDNSKRLEHLKEIERLKKAAFVDRLTGIGNRRLGNLALDRCFHDLRVHEIPFGIVYYDLDHFKQLNDGFGHEAGDLALKSTVNTALNLLRKMDTVCRWGGEEFLVVLPNVDLEILGEVAERLRAFVEKSWIEYEGRTVKATISAGATMALSGDDEHRLLKRVDELLYRAKRAGRNRVELG